MSGSDRPKRAAPVYDTVTAGAQTGPAGPTMEDVGERAIVHHFGCPRRAPLRWALVPGAVNYLCADCGERVSVGADGQPVGSPGQPMTDRAREALPKLPAVLADLKRRGRVTKTAVATGLEVDRKTLDTWIGNGWVTWPPSD